MIQKLKLNNIGPSATTELDFGSRLNLITGDNGLGKSFLLDIAWWALTRKWPAELNPALTCGKMARPDTSAEATISFSFVGKSTTEQYESTYNPKSQSWTGRPGRPANPGLVLYAMADGGFALWDPARNYWRTQDNIDVQERQPGFVFSPAQVWNGLPNPKEPSASLCNGLIDDWASWQKERGSSFLLLKSVLQLLSPSDEEQLRPGALTRIGIDNVKDIPTLETRYGKPVPLPHASSGIRRIVALAYILVWAWEEHKKASEQINEQATSQIIFLIDEIESHLHPTWQRRIIPAILGAMKTITNSLSSQAIVQLITATHSPLIMTSIEPEFDSDKDAWFDIDLDQNGTVSLRKMDFEKHGTVSRWLISDAFDQETDRAIPFHELIEEASTLIESNSPPRQKISDMHERLLHALPATDDYLFRWRAICKKKGFL